ncbi:MAG: glycosyltransferase family 2 protein [Candidatus Micrarchaeota archaeon]
MEKPPQPLVCVLIINYNGRKLLDRLLESFPKTDYSNYRLIVIDNGSTDGSMAGFKKTHPSVELFPLDKNIGFSGGNNVGIGHALKKYRPDYVLLLNNDLEVIEPGWLSEMVRCAESEPRVGIVGCKLLYPDNTIQHAGELFWPDRLRGKGEGAGNYSAVEEVQAVSFAAVLISRRLIEGVGALDEVFSPYGYEDLDLCMRARKAGYKVLYAGTASLHHLEGGSMKLDIRTDSLLARNAMIFYSRYAPLHQRILMAARIYARLVFRRSDRRRALGKGNFSAHLSPGDMLSLPARVLAVSSAIVSGVRLAGSPKVPAIGTGQSGSTV